MSLTDWNDLAQICGNATVKAQILGAIPDSLKPLSIVLAEREFDETKEPPDDVPLFKLKDTIIATRGNIVTITAQLKAGKSAGVGAMQAATMVSLDSDFDCLGFSSSNPEGHKVIHFDSEQSRRDHWKCSMRTLRRAGLQTRPPWFKSYLLAGLGYKRAWDCVLEAVKDGPIHSIFLDGIADFVPSVNDEEACNARVAELQSLAGELDCAIICVIHFNPGSDKSRGHLGSEIERKAESNLRLDKDNQVTVMWSEKQRGAPIFKDKGPSFQWSDDKQMHVSCGSAGSIKDEEERDELLHELGKVFSTRPGMSYSDMLDGLEKVCKKKRTTVYKKAKRAISLGLLSHVANVYSLNR